MNLVVAVAAEGKNILFPVQVDAKVISERHGDEVMGLHVPCDAISAEKGWMVWIDGASVPGELQSPPGYSGGALIDASGSG